ncbi:MAG: hypothetical protein QOE55_649 [Acidobacteriaceae bacterium]|jgi:hypothetical protein|nr:hypothetical protein [Acidobacteriaceae bacterium]
MVEASRICLKNGALRDGLCSLLQAVFVVLFRQSKSPVTVLHCGPNGLFGMTKKGGATVVGRTRETGAIWRLKTPKFET